MNTDPEDLAERLKDLAYDLGLSSLKATIRTSRDRWTTVEVHEAALLSDSRDGWDVVIEEGGL